MIEENENPYIKINQLMQKGTDEIDKGAKLKVGSNAVIVLGRTGHGKSTLLNLLAGVRLMVEEDGETRQKYLSSVDGEECVAKMGNSRESVTEVPLACFDEEDTVYWDCPGYNDNRNEAMVVAHAYNVQNLFKKYSNIKIIIMVDYAGVTVRATDCRELFEYINKLLKEVTLNVETVASCCSLVVNRVDLNIEIDNIYNTLRGCISSIGEGDKEFNSDGTELLKKLLEMRHVGIIHKPSSAKVNFSEIEEDNIKNIKYMVKNCNFADVKVNVIVPPEAYRYAMLLAHGPINAITKELTSLTANMQDKIDELMENTKDLGKLGKELECCRLTINSTLINPEETNTEKFLEKVNDVAKNSFNTTWNFEAVRQQIEQLNFLEKMRAYVIKTEIPTWKIELTKVTSHIERQIAEIGKREKMGLEERLESEKQAHEQDIKRLEKEKEEAAKYYEIKKLELEEEGKIARERIKEAIALVEREKAREAQQHEKEIKFLEIRAAEAREERQRMLTLQLEWIKARNERKKHKLDAKYGKKHGASSSKEEAPKPTPQS